MDSIRWPALLKLTGDDELIYLPDQAAWQADTNLQQAIYQPDDQLIDADGQVFFLLSTAGDAVQPEAGGTQLTLSQLTELIRAHESVRGSCCVAKMAFGSMAEAFAVVAHPG